MHAVGAVVEVATGQSWNALFQQRLAQPLGLTTTRFVLTTPGNPRIAGGAESNATEFGRFMEVLRRGGVYQGQRILRRSSIEAMFARQSPVGVPILSTPLNIAGVDGSDYGVGVWLIGRDESGQLLTALAAGARGFASWIDFENQIVGVFATDVSNSGNLQAMYVSLKEAAALAVRTCEPCDSVDFNRDGVYPDDGDIRDFFLALAGGPCPHAVLCDTDFNNNGVFPEDQDILDFFHVLAGGACD
jgi:CubicO group peptidase (beta-lactamase class C family)